MSFIGIFGLIILAGILGGASASMLGIFVIGLRIPFLAVCSAHGALAGAVFSELAGIPVQWGSFAGALATAAIVGGMVRHRSLDPNAALGSIFSLMLGLSFLGIGMMEGSKSSILGLLWGNLLFVTPVETGIMATVMLCFGVFVFFFEKELKLMLFNRELASLIIPEAWFYTLLLVFASAIITINLEITGGLLIYSLISNPALAALRLAKRFRHALGLSALMGSGCALSGFLMAYRFHLPVGACIALVSSILVMIVLCVRKEGGRP